MSLDTAQQAQDLSDILCALSPGDIGKLSDSQVTAMLELVQTERARVASNRIDMYYPDTGAFCRAAYPVHQAVLVGGAHHRQRLVLAANRVGKTEGILCYEAACHLTGIYPPWWEGRRWLRPVRAWLGGNTATTVRDILQQKLLGTPVGTGLLRADAIKDVTSKRGVPDAVENVYVHHVRGGVSVLSFKSYDQGRKAWEGTEQDFIGLDEEPPSDVYSEALTRTATTDGLVLATFTPLDGISDVTEAFLDPEAPPNMHYWTLTWDDVPHLNEKAKKELMASYPLHERDARTRGIPHLGSGRIYPVDTERLLVDDFEVPTFWKRGYALDVGWNRTAALWAALDHNSDCLYLYSEYSVGQEQPAVHAQAVLGRGIKRGLVDPAARGRTQDEGKKLLDLYTQAGLELTPADNAVEPGLFDVWNRLSSDRLKVFRSLVGWQKEYGLYRRDKHGKVVKKNDHLMDCMRYLVRGAKSLGYEAGQGNYDVTPGGTRYLSARPSRRYRHG